jgi:hypothetical protein
MSTGDGTVLGGLAYEYEGELVPAAYTELWQSPTLTSGQSRAIAQARIVSSRTFRKDHSDVNDEYVYYSHHLDGPPSSGGTPAVSGLGAFKERAESLALWPDILRAPKALHAHGQGRMQWANGSWYHGEFRRNLRHGQGTYVCVASASEGSSSKTTLIGSHIANVATNVRVCSVYVGDWEFDRTHGSGRLTTYTKPFTVDGHVGGHTGSLGEVSNGGLGEQVLRQLNRSLAIMDNTLQHAQLALSTVRPTVPLLSTDKGPPSCKIYEGQFYGGYRHGCGTLQFPSGGLYRGEFVFDKRCGHGEYRFPSGDVYVGQFQDDCRHGQGTMQYANGNRFEGAWDRDQRVHGTLCTATTGNVYHGALDQQGRMCGLGTYLWASGSRYEGSWLDDQAEGFGTYYRAAAPAKEPAARGTTEEGSEEEAVRLQNRHTSPPRAADMSATAVSPPGHKWEYVYRGYWHKNKKHTVPVASSSPARAAKRAYPAEEGNAANRSTVVETPDPAIATETYANGDVYTGQFTRGRLTGRGSYYHAKDGLIQKGLFVDGVFQGADDMEAEDASGAPAVKGGFWGSLFGA